LASCCDEAPWYLVELGVFNEKSLVIVAVEGAGICKVDKRVQEFQHALKSLGAALITAVWFRQKSLPGPTEI